MSILIFPDIHGRSFWQKPLDDVIRHRRHFDSIVFMGDYFDPYDSEGIDESEAIANWHRLFATVSDGVLGCQPVFLLGNHDAHYANPVFSAFAGGSRLSRRYFDTIKGIFTDNESLFRVAYDTMVGPKKVLFTHAGVNREWVESHGELLKPLSADTINALMNTQDGWFALSDVGRMRGGDRPTGGPLWADVTEHYDADGRPYTIDGYDYEVFAHSQRRNDPIINSHFAMLDVRRPFFLAADCTIHEYGDDV